MNILIIDEEKDAKQEIAKVLRARFGGNANLVELSLIQEGIELLEKREELYELIIFEYRGTGQALVRCLLESGGHTTYVMCTPDLGNAAPFQGPEVPIQRRIEAIQRNKITIDLPALLAALTAKGTLSSGITPDAEFIPMTPDVLANISPIKVDIYVKLAPNRFVKIFRKGEDLERPEIERYLAKKKVDTLYVSKAQGSALLSRQNANLEKLVAAPNVTEAQADEATTASLGALRDLVDRVGFTADAQAIAKTSVALTLRVLGSRPRLQTILSRLQQEEGKYITSHSLALGKLACALAYKVGWSSAATYLKLTLAAFLHDLPLHDNELAAFQNLTDVKNGGFSKEQLEAFRAHPLKAAEYAQQFNEIPADVDTILMQHHEHPDGSGFPRGLTSRYISPLSSLFIIAHDLLTFSMHVPKNTRMDEFFARNEARYSGGAFKKILKQLKEDAAGNEVA